MSDYLNSALDAVLNAASAGVSSVTPRISKPEFDTEEASKFQSALFDDLVVDDVDGGGCVSCCRGGWKGYRRCSYQR